MADSGHWSVCLVWSLGSCLEPVAASASMPAPPKQGHQQSPLRVVPTEESVTPASGVEARDSEGSLTMHRTPHPSAKNLPAQNVRSGKAEKPALGRARGPEVLVGCPRKAYFLCQLTQSRQRTSVLTQYPLHVTRALRVMLSSESGQLLSPAAVVMVIAGTMLVHSLNPLRVRPEDRVNPQNLVWSQVLPVLWW